MTDQSRVEPITDNVVATLVAKITEALPST